MCYTVEIMIYATTQSDMHMGKATNRLEKLQKGSAIHGSLQPLRTVTEQ